MFPHARELPNQIVKALTDSIAFYLNCVLVVGKLLQKPMNVYLYAHFFLAT